MKRKIMMCVIVLCAGLFATQAQERFTVKKLSNGHYDIFYGKEQAGHIDAFHDNVGVFKIGDYYGGIDPQGNVVFDFEFDRLDDYSEGLAFYILKKDNEVGYMDPQGNVVLCWEAAKFDYSLFGSPFRDGMAILRHGFADIYINKEGEVLHENEWMILNEFSEGLACVQLEEERIAFIDKTGRYVIGPKKGWTYIGPFKNGKAEIATLEYEPRYYYITRDGTLEYRYTKKASDGWGGF